MERHRRGGDLVGRVPFVLEDGNVRARCPRVLWRCGVASIALSARMPGRSKHVLAVELVDDFPVHAPGDEGACFDVASWVETSIFGYELTLSINIILMEMDLLDLINRFHLNICFSLTALLTTTM